MEKKGSEKEGNKTAAACREGVSAAFAFAFAFLCDSKAFHAHFPLCTSILEGTPLRRHLARRRARGLFPANVLWLAVGYYECL